METKLAAAAGVKRVVLTGSESTGKTELARQLAAHFGAPFVHEFVRAYVNERPDRPLTFDDHGPIARGVMALEDDPRLRDAALVVQDTDLLSTVVYLDHYYGQAPEWIVQEAARRRPDLYLLMEIDVPWVPDDVRDRGDRREEMQQLFRDAVQQSGAQFVVVRGDWQERLDLAVRAVEHLLADGPG